MALSVSPEPIGNNGLRNSLRHTFPLSDQQKNYQFNLGTRDVFHLQKISENFFREFPFGKRAFHLSQIPFVYRPISIASPKIRCLGKLFCYFLESVFVHRFPVKQMLNIGEVGHLHIPVVLGLQW